MNIYTKTALMSVSLAMIGMPAFASPLGSLLSLLSIPSFSLPTIHLASFTLPIVKLPPIICPPVTNPPCPTTTHGAPAPMLAAGLPAFITLGGGVLVAKMLRRFEAAR